MIKFYAQHSKGMTSVLEVEVREATLMESPSLGWNLLPGEALYQIIRPKEFAGDKYYSFLFYETEDACMKHAIDCVTQEATRSAKKSHIELDKIKLQEKIEAIKVSKLK